MPAAVAAVLFGLALLVELAGISVPGRLLVIADLLGIAPYLAGVGSRQVACGRRTRR